MGIRNTYYKFNRDTYPGVEKLNEKQFESERFAPLDPEVMAEIEKYHEAKRKPSRSPEEERAEAIEELGSRWTEMQEAQEKEQGPNPDTPFN